MYNTFIVTSYLGIKIIKSLNTKFLLSLIDIKIFKKVKEFFKLQILHFLFIIFSIYLQIFFLIFFNINI